MYAKKNSRCSGAPVQSHRPQKEQIIESIRKNRQNFTEDYHRRQQCLLLAQTAPNLSRCPRRRATCRKSSFRRSGIDRPTRLIDCHVSMFSVHRPTSNDSLKLGWRRTLIWSRQVVMSVMCIMLFMQGPTTMAYTSCINALLAHM